MRKIFALLFGLALFVPLAACGGDDDDSGSGSGSDASASASGTEEEEDASGDAEASDEFCEQAETFAEDESLDQLDFDDPDDVEVAVGLLEDFSDAAPDDVSEDIDRLVDAFGAIVEILEENEDDPAAQAEAFAELEDEFADVEDATTRVEAFVLDACGVDISGGGTTDDTAGG